MYERILVPLDGSDVAEAVLPNIEDLVIRMAPKTQVEVTLLQVISTITYNVLTDDDRAQIPYSESDIKQIKQKAKRYLDKVAARMKDKGVNAKTLVTTGHAAEEIIKAADDTGANLIAISTHGRSGLKRWALGSIADKVLHESHIPVLTVRSTHEKSHGEGHLAEAFRPQ
jgi:nucleotide-binding universal stress UspA family protein